MRCMTRWHGTNCWVRSQIVRVKRRGTWGPFSRSRWASISAQMRGWIFHCGSPITGFRALPITKSAAEFRGDSNLKIFNGAPDKQNDPAGTHQTRAGFAQESGAPKPALSKSPGDRSMYTVIRHGLQPTVVDTHGNIDAERCAEPCGPCEIDLRT